MRHPALELAGCWVELGLSVRQRSLGELLQIDITWDWEVSGCPMSLSQLSHLRASGLTPGQSTKTLSATGFLESHVLCPDGLNSTVPSQGCLLEVAPTVETGQNVHPKDEGGGEEPLTTESSLRVA